MAHPRVFVSSTYYDLKHIRSSLEIFVQTLGFDPVLSEAGDIAYLPDVALDESCYREAASADIFVLIIGGRYGSEISGATDEEKRRSTDVYESITKKEFETALKEDIPLYILIDRGVHAEYLTYLRNRDNSTIEYAHVESVNVFRFIDYIFSQPRNNPVFDFEKAADIEAWLKEQWSGLFREMLRSRSQQKQLITLTGQVSEMRAINETLKTYMEAVLQKVTPTTSSKLIKGETKRLIDSRKLRLFRENPIIRHFSSVLKLDFPALTDPVRLATSVDNLITRLKKAGGSDEEVDRIRSLLINEFALRDLNEAREILGAKPLSPLPSP
jgi:hypothetical protein